MKAACLSPNAQPCPAASRKGKLVTKQWRIFVTPTIGGHRDRTVPGTWEQFAIHMVTCFSQHGRSRQGECVVLLWPCLERTRRHAQLAHDRQRQCLAASPA